MSKIDNLREILKSGEFSLSELREKTGLVTNVLNSMLARLRMQGELERSGLRWHYKYKLKVVQ